MTRTRNTLLIILTLLILAALLFALSSAFAQDTPAPDAPPAATAEATPAPDEPPVIPANNTGSILLVVGAILAIVAGGGGILTMIERFRQNKQAVAATEQLGDSVPRSVADKLIELLKISIATGGAAIEALDGIPAADKPVSAVDLSGVPSSALAAELARRGNAARFNSGAPADSEDR